MTDPTIKAKEQWLAVRKQPKWQSALTNFHIRPVQCAKDGSFRIDQVDAGNYSLLVETGMPPNQRWGYLAGGRLVEIPVSDSKLREPLDLGLIEVSLKSGE